MQGLKNICLKELKVQSIVTNQIIHFKLTTQIKFYLLFTTLMIYKLLIAPPLMISRHQAGSEPQKSWY